MRLEERTSLKIAIIGVGAIGGYVGARLAHAGEDVTFIARGANLEALRSRGIRLVMADGTEEAVPQVNATDGLCRRRPAGSGDSRDEGAPSRGGGAGRAEAVRPRHRRRADAERNSLLVFSRSWRSAGRHPSAQRRSERLDRREHSRRARHRLRGVSGRRIGCARRHQARRGQPLSGRRAGRQLERARQAACRECFIRGGLQAPVLADIRAEIWLKLWGNLTFNPISALSRATLAGICQYPPSRALARGDDDRGAEHRQQARHHLPRAAREAHRRRGARRPPQDLDAAGCGGRRARSRSMRCWVRWSRWRG